MNSAVQACVDCAVHTRIASEKDLPALATLFDAYRQFNGKPAALRESAAFLKARMANKESVVLVAGGPMGLAGFAQLYPTFSSVSLARVFIVNDLFVEPQQRRQGVASALLQAAAHYAHERGAVRLSASTAVDNLPTHALNEANGMRRDQSFFVYHRVLPGQ